MFNNWGKTVLRERPLYYYSSLLKITIIPCKFPFWQLVKKDQTKGIEKLSCLINLILIDSLIIHQWLNSILLKYLFATIILTLSAANFYLFAANFFEIFTCGHFPYQLFAADCPHTVNCEPPVMPVIYQN